MKKLRYNPVKAVVRKLQGIKADPVKVALGFAFGVFMSTTPFIGFKWAVALPVVWVAKWNKVACLLGILQVNYLTGPLFYALAFFLGKAVCGFSHSLALPEKMTISTIAELFLGNANVFVSLLVGGLLLSIPMTIGSYFLARSILNWKLKPQLS
ncbi:MAG TPA: DUF2062 domain-containing protein [Bacteroidales bacterium]|nr:DUF2062 domain-containing protein [Bacteroidales bacterium]